jgi:polyhydroxyalkanoate synthesis regulator protein
MFERAMQMFTPFAPRAQRPEDGEPKANGAGSSDEISELKSEIEAMRKQLAELSLQRK